MEKLQDKKCMNGGDYHLEVMPMDNKTWRNADDLEIAFTLTQDDGVIKTFKGKATLIAIRKVGK